MTRARQNVDEQVGSPDHGNPVPGEIAITGRKDEVFGKRLGHQNPVDRVFLTSTKNPRERTDVRDANRERWDARLSDILIPRGKRIGKQRAGLARLQDQFPEVGDPRGEWRSGESFPRLRTEFFPASIAPRRACGCRLEPERPSIQSSASPSVMGRDQSFPTGTGGAWRAMPNGNPVVCRAGTSSATG